MRTRRDGSLPAMTSKPRPPSRHEPGLTTSPTELRSDFQCLDPIPDANPYRAVPELAPAPDPTRSPTPSLSGRSGAGPRTHALRPAALCPRKHAMLASTNMTPLTTSRQDSLKALWSLGAAEHPVPTSHLARQLRVRAPSVTAMLGRLTREGLVRHAPRAGARLTA